MVAVDASHQGDEGGDIQVAVRERLALHSSKTWLSAGVQVMDCEPLVRGPEGGHVGVLVWLRREAGICSRS
jgi:hypothetical protein